MDAHQTNVEPGLLTPGDAKTWVYNGRVVKCTRIEWGILDLAYRFAGAELTFQILAAEVWGARADEYFKGSLFTHVNNLKRKLGCGRYEFLVAISGEGYRVECRTDRPAPVQAPPPQFGPVNERRRLWACNDRQVYLAPKEWRIVSLLHQAAGEVVRYPAIARNVWGSDNAAAILKALQVAVGRINQKFGSKVIVSEGYGYRICPPSRSQEPTR